MQKFVLENKYYTGLFLSNDMDDPKFTKLYECKVPQRQPNYMSVPLVGRF